MQRPRARFARSVLPLAFLACLAAGALAPAATGADGLRLWRSRGKSSESSIDFFVSGAPPGEQVFFTVTASRTEEASQLALRSDQYVIADVAGNAFFHVPDPAALPGGEDGPFHVRAFVRDPAGRGRLVGSNFAFLHDLRQIFLLVEEGRDAGRLLRFDPKARRLGEALDYELAADAAVAIAGSTALVESGSGVFPLDGRAGAAIDPREEILDLAVTPDQSAVLALTLERLTVGRALLRLRVLDAEDLESELGLVDVLRGGSRLARSWLVTGDDSHRVLVAEPDGAIREVTLGSEPARGLTFLPLAPDSSEQIVDVRVADELLVTVTRPAPGRAPRGPQSRLLLLDLRTRADPIEWPLPAAAVDFELASADGRLSAFVTLADGRIAVLRLDSGETPPPIELPGADRLERSPVEGRLYVLAVSPELGRTDVFELDSRALAITPLALQPLPEKVLEFRVFGDAARHWLYVVSGAVGGEPERLFCCRLDPESGQPLDGPTSHALPGRLRRIAGR
jgi:hypothetical protein